MSLSELSILFAALVTLALVPSASVALVIARSASAGFLNGAAVAGGIVAGDIVFVILAIVGMVALAETMGSFFLVIRYLAGVYLIWFGISLMRSNPSFHLKESGRSVSTLSASFVSGFFLTLGDVKAIFFYASLFPAFVDVVTIEAADITILVMLTIAAVGGVKLAYAYFATSLVTFARNLKAERTVQKTAGGLMVGTGAYLIAKV